MGLIRSGNTGLTAEDDSELVSYLWPIVREMIKTAIENNQNLIVEGCYIPFDWKKDFDREYLKMIKGRCLIMTEQYIKTHFADILKFAKTIESRLDDSSYTIELAIKDNKDNFEQCKKHGCDYILIDGEYEPDIYLQEF